MIEIGESEVVTITYLIDEDYQGDEITDWAEISFASETDGGTVNATDIDSQADNVNFNQAGETDDLIDDNVDDESGLTGGDEDDHDPVQIAVGHVFDLALLQNFSTFTDNDGDGVISQGDDVVFDITVFNQGTLDATDVEVTNYVPTGTLFDPALNPGWDATAVNALISELVAGEDTTFSIVLTIDPTFQGTGITNWAEISDDNSAVADIDSEADAVNFNQDGETDDLNDDNVVNQSGLDGMDEDDHDPAHIVIGQVFDLALIITINTTETPGPYYPGDEVTFDITVYNQGTLDAYDIQLADYIPTGMNLTDPNWDDVDGDGIADLINPIDFIPAGDSQTVTITCLLYTSPSPRDATLSRMPSSA